MRKMILGLMLVAAVLTAGISGCKSAEKAAPSCGCGQ